VLARVGGCLIIELLARAGVRADELADLAADAVVRMGQADRLRIPLGKLRNDRNTPLHPELVQLAASWTAANLTHIRAQTQPWSRVSSRAFKPASRVSSRTPPHDDGPPARPGPSP
jgi:hypothetical protein